MKTRYQRSLDDYARYHQNHKNKITHYLGIPMIVLAVVVLLRAPAPLEFGAVRLDWALLVMVPVSVFYLSLNLVSALGMIAFFALCYVLSPAVGTPAALAVFILGWVLQFVGHHFEGKKPAFFKNAVHLLIGPLWILNDLFCRLHLPAYEAKGS